MPKVKSWEQHKAECEAVAKEGITIIGFIEPWNKNLTKLICNCEKHGTWETTTLSNFKMVGSCPNCSKERDRSISWLVQKPQCEKLAKPGITILGFIGPWRGSRTKLHCHCKEHGKWSTTSVRSFKRGSSCPRCHNEESSKRAKSLLENNSYSLKEDSLHIEKFMATGKFPLAAKFYRSDRLDKRGFKSYWNYICPVCSSDDYVKAGVCSGIFERPINNFQKGSLPCRCVTQYRYSREQWVFRLSQECLKRGYTFISFKNSTNLANPRFLYTCEKHGVQEVGRNHFLMGGGCARCAGKNQQDCYINVVYDEEIPVALKFGITTSLEKRLKRANSLNLFQMEPIQVFNYESASQCRAAERACLQELDCGILTARELKDGWTETTSIQNLDKITEIYKRFGGVRIK